MVRFLVRRVVVPAVVVGLVVMAFSEGVPSLVLGWAVLGYLVWRAAPGIGRDFGLLRKAASVGASSGRHGGSVLGSRVHRARSGDL